MVWSQGKACGRDLRDRVFSLFYGGALVGQVAQ